MRTLIVACSLALVLGGCSSTPSYNPDWDAESPIAGGKADGLIDAVQVISFGETVTGQVGGQQLDLFAIDLRRTDQVQVTLTVTDGDLNPHVSVYWGTGTYVHSDSWKRDGAALTKQYSAEYAGRFLVAARAYQGQGEGRYALTVSCLGGPCNGEFPPPASELEADEAADCIATARKCAFAQLSRYAGAVGPARAHQLLSECLAEKPLEDGTSCAAACDWLGPYADDDYDDAAPVCADIEAGLIFYADQTPACLTVLDDCMDECYDAAGYAYSGYTTDRFFATVESACWSSGFNGSCDSYARSHEACGGELKAGSAGECVALCHSTSGAHIDDLDTICSSDSYCDESCDVDLELAAAACGGLVAANYDCLSGWLDDHHGWICEAALEDAVNE